MPLIETPPDREQDVIQGEVAFEETPTLTGALKIVLGDFNKAELWLSSKQWALRWRESQLRYEPIRQVQYWEGTTVPRSSLNVYSVAQVVQSINAKVMEGLFADDPPFVIQPRKGTGSEEARAISSLLHYQIEDCDFRREIEDGAADAILFGTSIWKANWKEEIRTRKTYRRKSPPAKLAPLMDGGDAEYLHTKESDDIEYVPQEFGHGHPVLELQDLYTTYVDPGCRRSDIRTAKWVISRVTVSAEELNAMRDWEGYKIPSESRLMELLFPREEQAAVTLMESQQSIGNGGSTHQAQNRFLENSTDPTMDESRFEIIERWDRNKVIAVLNRKIVIRDEDNPWDCIPYFSVGWWRVPNSFYSMGVGISAGDEQETQRGLLNSMLDEVAWNLNLPILVDQDQDNITQNVRMNLGKFLRVKDPAKSMKQMERLQAVPEGYAEIQASQARIEASTGANELLVQGSMPSQGRTSIGRTATGANLLAGGSGSRLESFVERLSTQVIVPALNMFFEMDKQLLDMEQLRNILDDQMLEAFDGDHVKILNARVRFDVLAASRMTARQRMAQSLPMMLQSLLTDPIHQMLTVQGKKLNIDEAVNMWFDITSWKNKASLIQDMTDEDKQRAMAMNPNVVKAQADMQKQQMAGDQKLQSIDADNAGRAYREVQRQVIQHELEKMQVTGNPDQNMLGQ